MANPKVEELYTFPVKGARGERPAEITITPEVGIVGDRRFGIKRTPKQGDGWMDKIHFRVCMNTPEMAVQVPVMAGGRPDPAWLKKVASAIGAAELATLDTQGKYNLVDTNPFAHGPTVSFLNLATVRAIAKESGLPIEPERFRMNIWFDNNQPFSELDWANDFPGTREFMVGKLKFRIQDACERCLATEANPATGKRDLPVLETISTVLKKRGYKGSPQRGVFEVMGFLATPLSAGTLARGQEIRLL